MATPPASDGWGGLVALTLLLAALLAAIAFFSRPRRGRGGAQGQGQGRQTEGFSTDVSEEEAVATANMQVLKDNGINNLGQDVLCRMNPLMCKAGGLFNMRRDMNMAGKLFFGDDRGSTEPCPDGDCTRSPNNTDPYYLQKIAPPYLVPDGDGNITPQPGSQNNVSSLRLTINADPDESFEIWGNACTEGDCSGPGARQHVLRADGTAAHSKGLVVGTTSALPASTGSAATGLRVVNPADPANWTVFGAADGTNAVNGDTTFSGNTTVGNNAVQLSTDGSVTAQTQMCINGTCMNEGQMKIAVTPPSFDDLTLGGHTTVGNTLQVAGTSVFEHNIMVSVTPTEPLPQNWLGGVQAYDVLAYNNIGVSQGGVLKAAVYKDGSAFFGRPISAAIGDDLKLPDGWGGGVHTLDVYAHGSVGVGPTNQPKVVMSQIGVCFARDDNKDQVCLNYANVAKLLAGAAAPAPAAAPAGPPARGPEMQLPIDPRTNQPGKVTLHGDCNFEGGSPDAYADSQMTGRWDSNSDKMHSLRLNNVSSVRVPPGARVTLYSGPNFDGDKLDLFSDNKCLNDIGWGDRTQSFEINR